jgi:SAM-dependent methyltransferase
MIDALGSGALAVDCASRYGARKRVGLTRASPSIAAAIPELGLVPTAMVAVASMQFDQRERLPMSVVTSDAGEEPQARGGKRARLGSARALLRLAFHVIKPKRLYEPVELGGRRFAEKRDADTRWQAIAAAIREYDARNILDIGCAEGWFLRRAAQEFGCFGIGIDADSRRVLLGEIARLHDGVERVAIMGGMLGPTDIRRLPVCDIVLSLSVVHHVMRSGGRAAAEEFVQALATRARKALIFEMGTSDEKMLKWAHALPDMPNGQEAFVTELLDSCGLKNVRKVAVTAGLKRDAPRILFIAEPA